MKHLVEWNKKVHKMVGRTKQIPLTGHWSYTSKCGRFIIERMPFSSGPSYHLIDAATGKRIQSDCSTLEDAKMWADYQIDPNWEG